MTVRRVGVKHVDFVIGDLQASRRFYGALAPLGYELLYETEDGAGFGIDGIDDRRLRHQRRRPAGAQRPRGLRGGPAMRPADVGQLPPFRFRPSHLSATDVRFDFNPDSMPS